MQILAFALILLAMVLPAACGGPPDEETTVSVYADLEATQGWAREQGFKYCNALTDYICQSPDSVLEFRMPRRLQRDRLDRLVQEEMSIINGGLEPITLVSYHMTAVDDSNHIYEADVHEPGYFQNVDVRPGGLRLDPNEETDLEFTIELRGELRVVRKVTFWYKLEDRPDTSRVVVSYLPSSYRYRDDVVESDERR